MKCVWAETGCVACSLLRLGSGCVSVSRLALRSILQTAEEDLGYLRLIFCSCGVCHCCCCLSRAVWPTVWTPLPLSLETLCTGPQAKKAGWEPSVRCYKLLARPAARPREPDLAARRLRRVKRCTQRSSLHLYAPYIGRLLLQPTGTWLLAS